MCVQSNSFLISSRLLSNGILTPKEGGIPPELLSSKKVLTPEHVPGMKYCTLPLHYSDCHGGFPNLGFLFAFPSFINLTTLVV